jgi:hypothetical protein
MLLNKILSLVKMLLNNSREEDKEKDKAIWCVVANIVDEHSFGESKEIKKGTKHFSKGTKVYCFPPLWGDGYEKIQVIGHHKGSHRYVKMVVASKLLINWRVKLVYSPFVISEMNGYWDNSLSSKKMAETLVKSILENSRDEK